MCTILIRWIVFDVDLRFTDPYLEDSEELDRDPEITWFPLDELNQRLLQIRRVVHESLSTRLEDTASNQTVIDICNRNFAQVNSMSIFWNVYLDIACYTAFTEYGLAVRIVWFTDQKRNDRTSRRIRSLLRSD
jgi:hypothetical protein